MKLNLIFYLLISLIKLNYAFVFEYLSYTAAAAVGYTAYKMRCNYVECCEIKDVEYVGSRLKNKLKYNLFGQPLATNLIPEAIQSHLNKADPNSPLIISLHGWTGSGKTYTSKFIAESLFEKGLKSIYVKKITPSTFFPNPDRINQYKESLVNFLEDQAKLCKYSLIIIEEIDKLHPKLIDTLASYLNNYNPEINHNIFVFTSNVGSDKIVQKTFDIYKENRPRESIELSEFESIIKNQVYNDESTMKYSSLISSSLISHFIPFLPLERSHIDNCVDRYLQASDSLKQKVRDSLEWWPSDLKLYSTSGCKQVENKIDVLLRKIY